MSEPVIPPPSPEGLSDALRRNIEALEKRRVVEEQVASARDRIARAITGFTGSIAFVCLHALIYGVWILLNIGVFSGLKPFDPSFVILASEASVEAIFLSTFVLISQNRMAAAADKRAALDLHINLLTEHELTKLAKLVSAMADKLGVSPEAAPDIEQITRDVAPEEVLEELERARACDQ